MSGKEDGRVCRSIGKRPLLFVAVAFPSLNPDYSGFPHTEACNASST